MYPFFHWNIINNVFTWLYRWLAIFSIYLIFYLSFLCIFNPGYFWSHTGNQNCNTEVQCDSHTLLIVITQCVFFDTVIIPFFFIISNKRILIYANRFMQKYLQCKLRIKKKNSFGGNIQKLVAKIKTNIAFYLKKIKKLFFLNPLWFLASVLKILEVL